MTEGSFQPGTLVDYRDGDTVTAGVVLGVDGTRLHVVSEGGREERITSSRVALRVGPAKGSGRAVQAAEGARLAGEHSRRAAVMVSDVEVEVLWDLLADGGEGHALEELASLSFGRADGGGCGAVLRALLTKRIYFQRKDDLWFARSRDAVRELLLQKTREEERARAREGFIVKSRAAMAGEGKTPQAGSGAEGDEAEEALWRSIEALAVRGQNVPEARGAAALLAEVGVPFTTPEEGAFRLGVALGRFDHDENIFLRRFGLRLSFPEAITEAARRAASRLPEVLAGAAGAARRDLVDEPCFTIDDEDTVELDDALSLRVDPDGARVVGIHVADPSAFVEAGDALDVEAQGRCTSHYMPDARIAMMPPEISERAASLVPGERRPALSFLARFSEAGERLGWEIVPSVILNRRRMSYEDANRCIQDFRAGTEAAPECAAIGALSQIAGRLERERIERGAVRIVAPEVEARPAPGGGIRLLRVDPDRPGRRLVAEMMVLAGSIAAEYCVGHNVPVLYRRQAPPEEKIAPLELGSYDPVAVRRARRAMRRGEVGTQPGPHSGLGLPAYVQATSPLRRYQDLVAHRQIAAHLSGASLPYDLPALQRIAASSEEAERQARTAERGVNEYWLLRYLEGHVGREVEAIIVEAGPRRAELELCETLLPATVPARPGLVPGQMIRVVVERVVPRASLLSVREA